MLISSFGARRFACLLSLVLLPAACSSVDPPPKAGDGEVKPLVADLHRDHGNAALQAERYKEATSYFNRILKDLPDDEEARLGLGEAYLGLGRLDDARGQFETVDVDDNAAYRARALQGLGIVLLRQGEGGEARRYLDQALKSDAGLWRSWNALGRLRDSEKDHEGARQAYRKAIALNPKAAFLHNNLGFSLLASGEPAYAEEQLHRALALDPGLDIAATNLRLALALQGRYGPALAGASPSERAVVLNNVGYAALLRGDHRKARDLFRDAMAADPGFFDEAKRNLTFLETLEDERTQQP